MAVTSTRNLDVSVMVEERMCMPRRTTIQPSLHSFAGASTRPSRRWHWNALAVHGIKICLVFENMQSLSSRNRRLLSLDATLIRSIFFKMADLILPMRRPLNMSPAFALRVVLSFDSVAANVG